MAIPITKDAEVSVTANTPIAEYSADPSGVPTLKCEVVPSAAAPLIHANSAITQNTTTHW